MEQGWDQDITQTPKLGYFTIRAEIQAMRDTKDAPREELGDVVDAMGMHGKIDTAAWDGSGDSYTPNYVWDGKRSSAEDDLEPEWLKVLLDAQEQATNPWIVGKLGDLIWRAIGKLPKEQRKRAVSARDRAGQAWLALDPIGTECEHDVAISWCRAASLARESHNAILQARGKETFLGTLKRVLETPQGEEAPRLAGGAAEAALRRCKMDQGERKTVTDLLVRLAARYEAEGDHNWSQGTRKEAVEWACKAGENGIANDLRWQWGLEQIQWAEATHGGEGGTPWVLAMLYSQAIVEMAQGASQGASHEGRPEHLEALRRKQHEYAERSHEGLTEFRSEPVDISTYVEESKAAVRGRTFNNAALGLAVRAHSPRERKTHEDAAQRSQEGFVLHAMTSAVVVNKQGQEIRHSLDPEGLSKIGMEHFTIQAGLAVDTRIVPMMAVIREEHGPAPIEWYVDLCEKSAWVPDEHKASWARGLKHGMEREWFESMHILLPRIESCLRHVARQAGTLRTKKLGGRHDVAWWLNDLLTRERSEALISEAWRTELHAAACGTTGWNLRNEHCHGLLDDDAYATGPCVYTWWLLLHCTACAALETGLPLRTPEVQPHRPGNVDTDDVALGRGGGDAGTDEEAEDATKAERSE